MAASKSNRSARQFGGMPGRRPSQPECRQSLADADILRAPVERAAEWLRDLTALRLRLRAIYGTAIAAELALRRQAAEQDAEIADCAREGLCNPLSDEIDKLEGICRRLLLLCRDASG